MIVWVGTENRQHILGHIGLLGAHGQPVFPMSASGPEESYLGDPLWSSLAEWADQCHEREGLAVGVHFPYPTGEAAADIIMGKLDAVELWPDNDGFNTLRCVDWYRYLNCGYRLPLVGGTDKMGAYEAAGRQSRLCSFGRCGVQFWELGKSCPSVATLSCPPARSCCSPPTGTHRVTRSNSDSGGGKVEVEARATCFCPVHDWRLYYNGRVVASREQPEGAREMNLKEAVKVPGAGLDCGTLHIAVQLLGYRTGSP